MFLFMGKKGTKIKQQDITDCGAACLASVCAFYGLRVPIARIRQYAFTDKKGTNVLGMIEAAGKLGLSAKGVRAELEALSVCPKPMIAHVSVQEGRLEHYIVIYRVCKSGLRYMDPADGVMHDVTMDAFKDMWTGVLILLEPASTFEQGNHEKSTVKRFYELLAPHKSVMLQALFGAVIYSILGLSTAVYVGKITDNVLVDKNLNLLNLMGVIMIAVLVLRTFIGAMKSILALKTGQRIDATLILGYYKHLLGLPQQFFDTMRVGEIISRVNDAVKIRTFINNVSLDLAVNMMILIFTLCLMFMYSWTLASITLISAPLFLLIYCLFNRLNRKYQRKIMESSADLESQLVESVNAISTIKRFGIEEFANMKTEGRFVQLLRNTFQSIYGSIIAQGGIQFVSTGITIAVLWIGSILVVDQELTPGTLMVFYSLVGYVISPVSSLITSNQTIQDAMIAADRLFQIMDLEREKYEKEGKREIPVRREMPDIVFENVSFSHGSRQQIFNNLNLRIEWGQTTAIVGESGSGKSTLAALLQGLYPLQAGRIMIGDCDISEASLESLRHRITVVPQRVELFAGTVLENIILGDHQPDMKKIERIERILEFKDFVDKLPRGYYTEIGENGTALSGGERQRIAIACAMYQDGDIIIFDEATSALDSFAEENAVLAMEEEQSEAKTVIVIAHRLSTVRLAEKIVVLDRGRIVEEGRHKELMAKGGIYAAMWRKQHAE